MANKSISKGVKEILKEWLKHPHRIYLLLATVGIFGFVFITPPFQGPDEVAHFIRVQYIAQGHILPVDPKATGASLPVSIQRVVNETTAEDPVDGYMSRKYDIHHTKEALKIALNSSETYQPPMISYSALPYIPAIPGVVFANALGLSPIISMYIARLFLGLTSTFLIFLAIKILPYRKYAFLGIALIPMLLFQQSVVSIDGITYSLLILFIAYVLYLREKQKLKVKDWLILGVICVSMMLAKPLVFLFLPFVAILLNRKKAWRWIAVIAVLCAGLYMSMMFYNAQKNEVVYDPNTPKLVNSEQQTALLIDKPARFARVLWNTYMTEYGDDVARGTVGIFGAADTKLPMWIVMSYSAILVIFMFTRFNKEDDKFRINRRTKLLIALLCVMYFILANLAIYLSFSPVNFNIVYGIQGRYFLPILLVLPILLTPVLVIQADKRKVTQITLIVLLGLLLLISLLITAQRYYLYTP